MALECCAESKDALRLCIDNEILHQFIIKVKDDSDILSQSVAIEMLERLARTELGYDWLLGQEVMTDLVGTLDDADNPLSSFIQPGKAYRSRIPFYALYFHYCFFVSQQISSSFCTLIP